jgi:hypothetical protein
MPGMPGMPGQGANADGAPPEFCLVRVIDPTVQPGQVYKYRLRVRMANPNYGLGKQVASAAYAQKKELEPGKWFEVKDPVSVPPEMYYYAVDQRDLDGYGTYAKEKRLNWDKSVGTGATALQIHRWLEAFTTKTDRNNPLPVGEWVIADRVVAHRGEYVGADQRIEFPYWRPTQEQFVIASEPGATRRSPGVMVSFKPDWGEGLDTVLVDFSGGREDYERVVSRDEDGKVTKRKVSDACGTEVLLLTPDGKLLAHEGAEDTNDKERKERLKQVRDRLKEVKEGGTGVTPGTPTKPSGGRRGGLDS